MGKNGKVKNWKGEKYGKGKNGNRENEKGEMK